jgi:hypothetical protein
VKMAGMPHSKIPSIFDHSTLDSSSIESYYHHGQTDDSGARSGSKAGRERKGREAGEIEERVGASNLLAHHVQDQ